MWVLDVVTGLVTWLSVGFGMVLIGYRFRGWKGDTEETELLMLAMTAWPILLAMWLVKAFAILIKKFGRMAAEKTSESCQKCGH